MATLKTTAVALQGGADAVAGVGMDTLLTVGGTWAAGDKLTVIMTDNNGVQTQVGAGNVGAVEFTNCFTFKNKIYGLSGATAYFSALGSPLTWNDPTAAGNSYIEMSNFYATPEDLVAVAPFQGKLAFIATNTVQIWAMDPNPDLNAQQQVLVNIGTVAPLSVQAIGDMDIYMLAESGIRSVRVREASSNALVEDVGSPIDLIIQPLLATMSAVNRAAACSTVEPLTNRYWCYLPGDSIYVYSDFKNSQVEAWATYAPTYQAAVTASAATYPAGKTVTYTLTVGQVYAWKPGANDTQMVCGSTTLTKAGIFTATATTATASGSASGATVTGSLSQTVSFTPEKMVTYGGKIYVRAGDDIFLYGGTNNTTYDACGLRARTPFLDCDSPATQKNFQGMDCAIQGDWQIAFGSDYATADFETVIYRNNVSSFQRAKSPINRRATHFALDFLEVGDGAARLSKALVHFQQNQPK